MMNQARWFRLMSKLDFAENHQTFQKLVKAYAEPHRHYHTAAHINATLKHLDTVIELADKPAEIELALWFHDAIYRPFSQTNEADSASWAANFMRLNQASEPRIDRVNDLIMATCHQAATKTTDQALMVDVDLSILGSTHDLYAQYEEWIRQEYRWVPRFIYRRKRKALLQGFLMQSQIYQTSHFQDLFESKARSNMRCAISQL